ncbi:MAG: DUF1015 family protein [Clostridia bacterium]|nr:DUF1015 family protein [Clostridia bacterium]
MAVFRPFRAIRPLPEYASGVAELPYDVMNTDEARVRAADRPYSFLHVDKAEIDLPPDTDLYSEQVYLKAKENLEKLVSEGICAGDATPCYYIYRQIMNGRAQTGIVGCASIDDYLSGVIKRHELTRADKELDRINHVDTCDANTGPIFLAYRPSGDVRRVIEKYVCQDPVYDFTADWVRNIVWVVNDPADDEALKNAFAEIPALYIADGHHRCASAVHVGQARRLEHPGYTGEEEFNYFLAVAFDSSELAIMDYNRVIKDLNGMSVSYFMEKLGEEFILRYVGEGQYRPGRRHEFGMYLDGSWYSLMAKDDICNEPDPVDRLDVSILQKNVIAPLFGITDPRVDKRIDFIGGIRGLGELERRCRTDMRVAFAMYPTSIDELMEMADAGELMPPKSTWFEPKLLSGLFIHSLR